MSKEIKMTFGLTDNHIKVIEDKIKYWDSIYSNDEENEIKAINQRHVWISIGEDLGWEPLTALLYYLKHKGKYNATHLWNNASEFHYALEANGYWKALKDLEKLGIIELDKIDEL